LIDEDGGGTLDMGELKEVLGEGAKGLNWEYIM